MTMVAEKAAGVLRELHVLAEGAQTPRRVAEVARERAEGIERERAFLASSTHTIAFVGRVGVGKSSTIAVTCELLVGERPTDKKSLRESSVLAVRSGRTTVCEVRIRPATPDDPKPFGIVIDPLTVEEMRREIRIFALTKWAQRREAPAGTEADDDLGGEPTPQEVERLIRGMTNIPTGQETLVVDGKKGKRSYDRIDDLIARHDSGTSLANDLIERANLLARTEKNWWWDEDAAPLHGMQQRFEDINFGTAITAMMPRSITLVVPTPLRGIDAALSVDILDTRGFDGNLAARPDIQAVLRDPRTAIVVCSGFPEAPAEEVRGLLRDVLGDATLRPCAERILLLLVDKGDGDGVNGANGDRALGQDFKVRECQSVLAAGGLDVFARDGRVVALDSLQDDRDQLVAILNHQLAGIRAAAQLRLEQQVADAALFLENLRDARVTLAREEVDSRLRKVLEANQPSGMPLRDPLKGAYDAIAACRWASQVYASTLRNGEYVNLDAYSAVRGGATRAATEWLAQIDTVMRGTFRALEQDPELADVREHVRLRQRQYQEAVIDWIDAYADAVQAEVKDELKPDTGRWTACARRWGTGKVDGRGFKQQVSDRLEDWSAHRSLHAHEARRFGTLLPALAAHSDKD